MISTGHCRWLFLILSLTTWITFTSSKEMRVVCYYTNWSIYRPGSAAFSPQNINPYLCTHLIYAFGGFTKDNTLKPFDKYQDIEKGGYAKFTGLKTYNKNLKTMLAIGGWNEGSTRFSPMVADPGRRKKLVKNVVKFLRQNHFDGLDLDWEYPTFRDGGKPRDRDNYANLVQELREEFERESGKTGRPRLLLTMAVPAGIEYINKGYDVPKLTKYLDWMNILSYDYHSAFEPAVNHHAPLYPLEEDNEYNYDAELTIDHTIKHYLELGAEPNKLVLGIPTYGRSYTLFNPDAFEIGAPSDGPGTMGEATRENGFLSYYEICENIKSNDWEVEQPNPKAMGPYAFKDNQWVGYDDENIARVKAEYVAENGLGGIMFWSIDNDDFRGTCHGKPYPLIEAAKEALINAYGLTDENLISPPSKPTKSRTRTRTKSTNKIQLRTSDAELSETKSEKTSSVQRRRNRIKSKATEEEPKETTKNTRRGNRRKEKKEEDEVTYSSLKVVTPSYTTPAPPSTPDLNGAFKCEDEGFFPHPKDCKKYFWCLSGAGDSGLVAHQFTCPAGLYFNKAADSCDYSQNVLCNKKLQKATTPTTSTTTEASSATTSTTTHSTKTKPSTIKFFQKPSTTTTTEAYEEEEYDDDDEEEDEEDARSEEDPRVIKELIDLIRKAGGIEELEKQLKPSKDETSYSSGGSTTPSTISKALVEKVLSKSGRRNLYVPRNSRGPQNEGLSRTNSNTKSERGQLQYTSISRNRPSTPPASEVNEEPEIGKEVNEEEFKSRKASKSNQLEYVNIRRPRVGSSTEASESDRNRVLGETSFEEDDDDETETVDEEKEDDKAAKSTPQYVNIRRQKPSTTESPVSTSKYVELRRGTTSATQSQGESEATTSKYKTIRRGSTVATETDADERNSSFSVQSSRGTTTPSTTPNVLETSTRSFSVQSSRGITTPSTTPNVLETSTRRYVNFRRGTTEKSTEENESGSKSQTIGVASETDEITAVSSKPESTEASSFSSTTSYSSTPKDTSVDTLSSQDNSVTKDESGDGITENNADIESNSVTDARVNHPIEATETTTEKRVQKKRPQLFDPKPFSFRSTSARPITESTVKVSETTSRFLVRKKPEVGEKQNTPNQLPTRTRIASRLSADVNDEEDDVQETTTRRSRRRFSTTTTTERIIDDSRTYRTLEFSDLSSLTAVDFVKIKELNGNENNRRRRIRPVTSTTSATTTTTEELDESLRTGSRTLPVARKLISSYVFGNSRRLSNSGENSNLYPQTATTKKVRGFRVTREPSPTESTLELSTKPSIIVTPRNRRVIKRYRTTTTEATPVSGSSSKINQIDLDISLNRIDEGGYDNFDDSSTEEGENIKLSESNIRENSDVNSFRVDSKEEKKFTKTKGFNAFDKSFNKAVSPSTAEPPKDVTSEHSFRARTRKIIRKVIPTEATVSSTETASTTESNRRRKIIRRLRPVNTFIKTGEEKNVDKKAVFKNSETTATDEEKSDTDKFHLKATEDVSGHVESSVKATAILAKEADEETEGFRKHLFRPKISIKSATPESTDPKKRLFKPTLSGPEDAQTDSQTKFLLRPKLTDDSEKSNLPSRNRYFRPRLSKPRNETEGKEEDSVTVPSGEIGNGAKAESGKITVRPKLDRDHVATRNRFFRPRLPDPGTQDEDNEQEVEQIGTVESVKTEEKFDEEQISEQDDNFSDTTSSVRPISQDEDSEQSEDIKNLPEITTLNSKAITDEEKDKIEETVTTPAEDADTMIPIASSTNISTTEHARSTERNSRRRRPLRPISFVLPKTEELPRSTTEDVPISTSKPSLSDLRNKYIRYKSTERDNSNVRKFNRVYGFENEEKLIVESPKNLSETTASSSQSSNVSRDNNAENINDDISNIRQVNYTRLMSTISTETKDEMVDDDDESSTEANYVGTTFSDQLEQNAHSIPLDTSTRKQEYADTKGDNDNEDDNENIKKFTKFSRTMTSKTSTSMETVFTYTFNSEDDDSDNSTEITSDFMDNTYPITTETPMEDQSVTDTIRADVAFTNAIPKTEMTPAQEQSTASAVVNNEENEITTIEENYPATEKLIDLTSNSEVPSTRLDEMKTETSTDETEHTLQEITTVATTTTSRKTTTERVRSSFKPANARPKYSPKKLKDLSISSSTESSEVSSSQNRFRFKDNTKIENNKSSGLIFPKGNRFSTTERNSFRNINKLTSKKVGLTGYRFPPTTNKPQNKFLYKYRLTEKPDQEIEYDDEVYDVNADNEEYSEDNGAEDEEDVKDEEDEETIEEENIALAKVSSTSKPRPVNRPAFAKKQTTKVVNKPRLFTSTSIAPLTEDLSDIDQEAIKNRNKNLFSKTRKMNTPFVSGSTSSIPAASSETAAEAITTDSMKQETTEYYTTFPTVIQPETTEALTTLHHVFAEDITTSTPSDIRAETTPGKVERLVEVNRITKVETKENKIKNHMLEQVTVDKNDPVLDRVGEVNRITVIKIIDKEGNIIEKENVTENDIDNANGLSPVFIATNAKVEISSTTEMFEKGKISFVEVAKVQEVPSKSELGVVNLTNIIVEVNKSHITDLLNTNREDRKIDLFPDINISKDTHKNEYYGKPDIIDGRSHINVITPRPIYNTEASTIALEALFRTESSGSNFNKNFVTLNDELLETEHSKFVNVRVLHPDESMRLDKGIKDKAKFIPIKLLKQDEEEITMKAQVVEVTPRSFAEMIKIIPIKVEMSKHLVNRLPYLKNLPPT